MFSIDGIKVVSFFPGRVRLRVDKIHADKSFAKLVDTKLKPIPGIKKLEVSQEAGTVFIAYDKKTLKQPETSKQLMASLAELFPELDVTRIKKFLGV
jgi:copper chaperone CopZ